MGVGGRRSAATAGGSAFDVARSASGTAATACAGLGGSAAVSAPPSAARLASTCLEAVEGSPRACICETAVCTNSRAEAKEADIGSYTEVGQKSPTVPTSFLIDENACRSALATAAFDAASSTPSNVPQYKLPITGATRLAPNGKIL